MIDYDSFSQFDPDIIMLAFCYSINGDLVMLLRKCGFFSKMIINHDLKIITQNPNAWLDRDQEELLMNIGADILNNKNKIKANSHY